MSLEVFLQDSGPRGLVSHQSSQRKRTPCCDAMWEPCLSAILAEVNLTMWML